MKGSRQADKLRKVEEATGSPDTLDRIKSTWIGRLYANHLKQIPLVRWLTIRLWRNLYPIYTNIFCAYFGSRASKRWRTLVKLEDYVKALNLPTTTVFEATSVDTPAPKVFPVADQSCLVSPHDHYVFPKVYVAELGEALIYGGTNLVFAKDTVICHDLYDFERDYTSEELHGRHVIDAKQMRMRLLHHDETPEKIAVAAAFVDACATNYAHWLTEVLPRIAAFRTLEHFANVPIVVNDGLHRNIMESLELIVGLEREIITLPVGRGLQVDRLYVTSVAGYVPFERRNAKFANHSHGVFCPPAFHLIRDRLSLSIDSLPAQEWPRKVYLRRTSGARNVENAHAIEEVLLKNGYVAVAPERLSFLQQAALFNNAEDIVGSSGAALANMIFSPSTTCLVIFIGKLEGTSYWYWQNMAAASGKYIKYILGRSLGKSIHDDFHISQKHISLVLKKGVIFE